MPTPRSLGEVIVDVESLLAAMEINAAQLPNFDADKAELLAMLDDLKRLASQRENFKAEKLVVTQRLKDAKKRALDAMANLRAQLKGKLGTRNEKLNEFGVSPNRGAGGRKKKAPVPESKGAPVLAGVQLVQALQPASGPPGTPMTLVMVPSVVSDKTQT